jgi:hypothetical protein
MATLRVADPVDMLWECWLTETHADDATKMILLRYN